MLDLTHPDAEPACWSWPVPAPRTDEEWIAAELARTADLPADRRYDRADLEMMLRGDDTSGRWAEFHDGRCAICGERPGHLIDDHCHTTGQIRGRLCHSCNTREGDSDLPVFARYRGWHPAAILDSHMMYQGRGWVMGWPLAEVPDPYDRGPRPPTPWTTSTSPRSKVVMVGGGFMILDDEPLITPYESNRHVCTLDCPSPWRSDVRARGIGEAIRALLHDGIPRGGSTVAAELGITPWAEPGYAYESVMRACSHMVRDGRLVATPTEGESEHMLTLPEHERR